MQIKLIYLFNYIIIYIVFVMTLILLTSIIYFYTHDFLYTQVIIMYSSQKANLQINKSKYNNRGKLKYKKIMKFKGKI